MITIRLTFPAARYHATAWGRHVNEGVPEWPPSPYRLLRALYDVWQRKCFDLPEPEVRKVLESLADSPPNFKLPFAVATHTRSYLSANTKDPTEKNLVFDPFLVFDRPHACFVSWPKLELPAQDRVTLERLLQNLNFLGRSESWVEAALWNGPLDAPVEVAVADGASSHADVEKVYFPPAAYNGKQPWMDALTYSTANLMKEAGERTTLAPSRWLFAPAECHRRESSTETKRTASICAGSFAQARRDSTATRHFGNRGCRAGARETHGAHKTRQGDESKVSPLFSGKSADGQKRLDHGHVYILPRSNENGGSIASSS